MIDEGFEIKKKLNNLCLEAALKRVCQETEWVFFDERHPFDFSKKWIPVLENGAYILALFNHKSAEAFLKGERLLNRLLNYQINGVFPRYIHEFKENLHPYTSFYLYPYFFKILENFHSYLKPSTLVLLKDVLDKMKQVMQAQPIYKHLTVLNDAIMGNPLNKIDLSKENGLAISLLKSPIELDVDLNVEVFFEKGHIQKTLLDYILADQKGVYTQDLLEDHPLHLLLSLFYEPFEKKQVNICYDSKKRLIEGFVFEDQKGMNQVISFDQTGFNYFEASEEGFHLKGDLKLHDHFTLYFPLEMEVTQLENKGCYLLKNELIYIKGLGHTFTLISNQNLEFCLAKRQKELFNQGCKALRINYSGPFDVKLKMEK